MLKDNREIVREKTKEISSKKHKLMPSDWGYEKLIKLFPNIRNGFVGTATPYYVENGVKYLQGKNIKNGRIISDGMIFVSEEFHKKQKKSQLKKNDIVMVQSGHVGECAVINKEFSDANCHALIILSPNEDVDPKFYSYYFNSNLGKRLVYKITTGNTVQHILATDMKSLRVPVPNFKEQRKIAAILSTWDKAIELKERLIEQKKEQKKGLMQKLLTGEIRLFSRVGKINKIKLKGLVKEVKEKNNKNAISNVLSVTNSNGFIHQSEQFGRRIASKDLSKYKIVRKGQFAYNPSRVNVGSIDLLNKFDEGILSPMYVIFETVKEKILPEYLYQFIKSNLFLNQLDGLLEGSVRQSLNFNSLEQVKLFVPEDLNEQKEISEFLSEFDKQLNLLELELEKLQEQKKGLMQLLLTGKVRVKV